MAKIFFTFEPSVAGFSELFFTAVEPSVDGLMGLGPLRPFRSCCYPYAPCPRRLRMTTPCRGLLCGPGATSLPSPTSPCIWPPPRVTGLDEHTSELQEHSDVV